MDSTPKSPRKSRVGIIGGGPAGLACLRVFLKTPDKWDVVAFEGRASIGGVWYRDPEGTCLEKGMPPSSAIYDSLTTNLPHCIMAYHDYLFPPSTYLFPTASVVLRYLLGYASHFNLQEHIRPNCMVEECRWDGNQWVLKIRNSENDPRIQHLPFDFVLVANGHYNIPLVPHIPGLEAWPDDQVLHSAWYREPSRMLGKSVLVVGGGPSGLDLSREIFEVAKSTYSSVRGASRGDAHGNGPMKRSGIVAFEAHPDSGTGTAIYEDGTRDDGIEFVVLATGYQFNLPMFPESHLINEMPPKGVEFPGSLYNSRSHLYPLARHLFPIQDDFPPTSIAFVNLPHLVIPFALCEVQAAVAAKVFSKPETLDILTEKRLILERRKELLETAGENGEAVLAKRWHRFPYDEQFEYRRELLNFSGITEWRVDQWVIDAYAAKVALRDEWRDVVHAGEADEFVKGATTEEDWKEVIQKLFKRAEDRKSMIIQDQLLTEAAVRRQTEAHDL